MRFKIWFPEQMRIGMNYWLKDNRHGYSCKWEQYMNTDRKRNMNQWTKDKKIWNNEFGSTNMNQWIWDNKYESMNKGQQIWINEQRITNMNQWTKDNKYESMNKG